MMLRKQAVYSLRNSNSISLAYAVKRLNMAAAQNRIYNKLFNENGRNLMYKSNINLLVVLTN